MSDEGQKAVEAAAQVLAVADGSGGKTSAFHRGVAGNAIRAYLAALLGWQLMPIELVRKKHLDLAPPPPGLED